MLFCIELIIAVVFRSDDGFVARWIEQVDIEPNTRNKNRITSVPDLTSLPPQNKTDLRRSDVRLYRPLLPQIIRLNAAGAHWTILLIQRMCSYSKI